MNNSFVELQARLDESRSKENLNQEIAKIQDKLDPLKVQAEINHGQDQLNKSGQQIGKDLAQSKDFITYLNEITEIWDKLSEKEQDKLLENFFEESYPQAYTLIQILDTVHDSVESLKDSTDNGNWLQTLGTLFTKFGSSDNFKNIGKGRMSVRISK